MSWIRRLRGVAAPLAVLFVGLSLTTVAALATWRITTESEATALAEGGELVASLLSETMELGVTQVRSIQAFFEASEDVTAIEFSRFALHQGSSPGMVAIGFAPVVRPEDLEAFQSEARAERSQYVVVQADRRVVVVPDTDRPLIPVWFSHQHELAPAILGVDLASDPVRREAIDRALASDEPALSDTVEVLGDDESTHVEIYAPIDRGPTGAQGVVFASIDVEELLARASDQVLRGATLDVTDVTAGSGVDVISQPDRWSQRIDVVDREWRVDLTRQLSLTRRALFLSVVIGGTAISLLVALVSRMVASSRRRSRQIDEMLRSTRDKDVFLASVAHELRTPLTSVVGITALLSDSWQGMPTREVDELLSISHAEASDLGDLIEDLLVAGRLQAGAIHYRAETVDLAHEVRRVISRLNTTHQVVVEIREDTRLVHADPLRVRQIVRNIVVNGVRHATSAVYITTERQGPHTDLVISNDGDEIPPELAAVLFRPYQEGRNRPHQGSIGLGLPVSRRLADMMGGRLDYSYVDGWCRFKLTLPAAPTTEDGSVLAPHTTTHTRSSAVTR